MEKRKVVSVEQAKHVVAIIDSTGPRSNLLWPPHVGVAEEIDANQVRIDVVLAQKLNMCETIGVLVIPA